MLSVRYKLLAIFVCLLVTSSSVQAQSFLERLGIKDKNTLSNATVADGLREALNVGVERAVKHVGKNDGYLRNKKIAIPIPKSLRRVEKPLRKMGHGPKIDELVLSMNRAAEAAAPLAKDAFVEAISKMTLDDANKILKGSDTAATDYLSKNTREELVKSFTPHIRKTMKQYSVTEKYDVVIEKYGSSSFARRFLKGGIEEYTANAALDGLFFAVGEEEKRIRQQPIARSTDLLRKVFK